MKPSERIEQLFQLEVERANVAIPGFAAYVLANGGRVPEPERTMLRQQAVIGYLDDQHEREGRRFWLQTALVVLFAPGAHSVRFNACAAKAGLKTMHMESVDVFDTYGDVMQEAEREGLL